MNAAKIKILALKGKDLEKSRVMMTSYIIKRYAESERSWNFGIGLKVGYGLYVYHTRDISKLMFQKNQGPTPPLKEQHIATAISQEVEGLY